MTRRIDVVLTRRHGPYVIDWMRDDTCRIVLANVVICEYVSGGWVSHLNTPLVVREAALALRDEANMITVRDGAW